MMPYQQMTADSIVTTARLGQQPPSWQVFHARSAYFTQQIFLGLFVLVLALAGGIYLLANPLIAIVPGYGGTQTIDPGPFMIARTVDYIVIVIILAVGLWGIINPARQVAGAREQVLVLMPDGFTLGIKQPAAYPFATMQSLAARNYRGTIIFTITELPTQQRLRVRLDNRFGNARQLAGQIIARRNMYLKAQPAPTSSAPYPPMPPAPPMPGY